MRTLKNDPEDLTLTQAIEAEAERWRNMGPDENPTPRERAIQYGRILLRSVLGLGIFILVGWALIEALPVLKIFGIPNIGNMGIALVGILKPALFWFLIIGSPVWVFCIVWLVYSVARALKRLL